MGSQRVRANRTTQQQQHYYTPPSNHFLTELKVANEARMFCESENQGSRARIKHQVKAALTAIPLLGASAIYLAGEP